MTAPLESELSPVLETLRVHSPTAFSWDGEAVVQVPPEAGPARQNFGVLTSNPLVREMTGALYGRCYVRPVPPPAYPAERAAGFPARLSQANHGKQKWDSGWSIYEIRPGGQIFVQKADRHRSAMPGEYVTSGPPGSAPAVGALVSLLVARESFQLQPGFFFVFGEHLSDIFDDFQMVRFYFNPTPEGAIRLVDLATARWNRYGVPFRLKCLTDPKQYARADSVVLYVARRHFDFSARLAVELVGELGDSLNSPVPMFAKRFRDGVGLAEDPGTGESFGVHRCRLVAEGVVDAWGAGSQKTGDRVEAVKRRFQINGVDWSKPHLNPGSSDLVEPAAGGLAL